MAEPQRGWQVFYAGQAALCPGVKLGKNERRREREHRHGARMEGDRRVGIRPPPEHLTLCRSVFVRVGTGEIYRLRWLGDRWTPITPGCTSSSTSKCKDCGTLFEVQVERMGQIA